MQDKKKILVVDDRETWLQTISHILSDTYQITLCDDTQKAKRAFNEDLFDLVILDKNIGAESGLDLLKDLRRLKPDLRAIILTEFEDVSSAVASMKLGALDYVPKTTPNLIEVLRDRVQEAIDLDFLKTPPEVAIVDLIAKGESASLEFKSTLRWDVRERKPSKEIEKATIKTIAGFMNSDCNSDLLIGVSDDGEVIGLQADFEILGHKKDRDAFENFLMSRIFRAFGKDCSPLIKIAFYSVGGKEICQVRVSPAPKPMFFNDDKGEHLFVRTGNSTRSLSTREAIEYCRIRWKTLS